MPIPVEIVLTFDDKGAVTSARAVGKAGDEAGRQLEEGMKRGEKGAQGAAKGIGSATNELVKFAAQAFAAEKVYEVLVKSSKAAMEDERAARQLTSTVLSLTDGNQRAADNTNAMIAALERQSGVADEKLRPAFMQLLAATDDVEKSQKALAFASEFYTDRGVDMNTVIDTMTRAMVTGTVRGTDPFSIALRKAHDETGDWGKALNKVQEDLGKYEGGAGSTAQTMDKVSVAFDNAQEMLGTYINELSASALPALQAFGKFLGGIAGGFQLIGSTAGASIQFISDLNEGISLVAHGKFKEADALGKTAKAAFKDTLAEAVEESAATIKEWESTFTLATGTAKAGTGTIGTDLADAFKDSGDKAGAAAKAIDEWTAANVEALETAKLRAAAQAGTMSAPEMVIPVSFQSQEVIALPDLESRLTQDQADLLNPGKMEAWLGLTEEQVKRGMEIYYSMVTPWEEQEAQRRAADKQAALDALAAERVEGLLTEEQYLQAKADLNKKYDQVEAERAAQEQQRRIQLYQGMLNSLYTIAGAFGKRGHKVAVAIFRAQQALNAGEAVMDTAKAVTAALKNPPGPPYSIPQAVAAGLYGAAQVATILSQKPPAEPAYEQGTPWVPTTGPAQLHRGEAVVPAAFNPFGSDGRLRADAGAGARDAAPFVPFAPRVPEQAPATTTNINLTLSLPNAVVTSRETIALLGEELERGVRRGLYRREAA